MALLAAAPAESQVAAQAEWLAAARVESPAVGQVELREAARAALPAVAQAALLAAAQAELLADAAVWPEDVALASWGESRGGCQTQRGTRNPRSSSQSPIHWRFGAARPHVAGRA